MIFLILLFFLKVALANTGYLLYCPCMGRFGNQADHFLGALAFSKALNRTLVLPHWVEYRQGEVRSKQIPFDFYFKIEPLQKYHDVILMQKFMDEIAPDIWPPKKRISFCYSARGNNGSCNAKDGNPFGPFWDTFNVDFVGSETYGPLHFDVHHSKMGEQWQVKYPLDKWPVLAFVGAPASFPVQDENRKLQKYLQWNDKMKDKALSFIKTELPRGGFIGIHLRNGIDWVRACEHIKQSPNLFAAPQCLGYRNEYGQATQEMCYPTLKTIVKQLKRQIRSMNDVASVFVASDSNHMLNELTEALKRSEVSIHRLNEINPHLDLVILGESNHFIGNCISSFTAFVKRERDANGFKSSFWAFPVLKNQMHDEL